LAWHRHVAVLLALPALATVSACTSGGLASPDASSSHAPSPAASRSASLTREGKPSSTPTAASTATPGTVVTGLLTLRFDSPLPADPARAKVIAGFRQASILLDESEQAARLAPGTASYLTGSMLSSLEDDLSVESQDGKVPAGDLAYYLTQVTHINGAIATLTTCEDNSQYVEEYASTKALAGGSGPATQLYPFLTITMTLLAGHWAVAGVEAANQPAGAEQPCLTNRPW
jgi:hypothetical protein